MHNHGEDKKLLLQAQEGQSFAFDQLVSKHEKAIKGRMRFNGIDGEDLDIIFQEAIIQVWRKIDKCDPEKGGFYAFMVKTIEFMKKRYYANKSKERSGEAALNQFGNHTLRNTLLHQPKYVTFEDEDQKELDNESKKIKKEFHKANDSLDDEKSYEKLTDNEKRRMRRTLRMLRKLISLQDIYRLYVDSAEDKAIEKNYQKDIYDYALEELANGGTPHKVLVFILNKIIYSHRAGTKSGAPQKIYIELSDKKLKDIFIIAKEAYIEKSCMPRELVDKYLMALEMKLKEKDKKDGKIIGDKLLRDYYGSDPKGNISDWSYRVGQKLAKVLCKKYYDKLLERNLAIKAGSKNKKIN